MNVYMLIIISSCVIILSYFFNILAKKTNIPSVLMLILLGICIKLVMREADFRQRDLSIDFLLEIIGNIGLVMILLKAALNLKFARLKSRLLLNSFAVAAFSLGGSILLIGLLFYFIFPGTDYFICTIHAVPLSIMSCAILIPRLGALTGEKHEFVVYDSTFSDILGIMVFYFMIGDKVGGMETTFFGVVTSFFIAIVLAVLVALLLVFLFQQLKVQAKHLLIIGFLLLLFAIGQYFQLSTMLIVLVFGLVINNTEVFFKGRLKKYFSQEILTSILHDFHTLTLESSFLVRTFFFVLFGISITLSSLFDWRIAVNGLVIVLILYGIRFLALRFFARQHLFPEWFIAPKGLITIMLFFVIVKNEQVTIPGFDIGLLLYPIIITSSVMMISMISYQGEKISEVLLPRFTYSKIGSDKGDIKKKYKKRIEENVEKNDFNGF